MTPAASAPDSDLAGANRTEGRVGAATPSPINIAHDSHALAPEIQTLLDASPDAVLIADRAGRIVTLNRRVETLFATTAERLQGKSVEILLPERAREAHASARAADTASPTVRAMSARSGHMGLRADGTEFPVEVSLTPIVGSTAGLVMAVVHEVAARARLEAAIAGTAMLGERRWNAALRRLFHDGHPRLRQSRLRRGPANPRREPGALTGGLAVRTDLDGVGAFVCYRVRPDVAEQTSGR
jgi:PAS domain S-box-containing protein